MIFNDRESLLRLYNAVNGTDHHNEHASAGSVLYVGHAAEYYQGKGFVRYGVGEESRSEVHGVLQRRSGAAGTRRK